MRHPSSGGGSTSAAAFFDAEARAYDSAYDALGPQSHALRVRMAAALRLLGTGPGELLDAGMGAGRLCQELERRGWTVSGVDVSEEMLALARERLPGARLVCADIEDLPFPDSSFDAVVATGVLEYAIDRTAAIRELARVLRPGGVAVVSVPNVRSLPVRLRRGVLQPIGRVARRALGSRRREPPPREHLPSLSDLEEILSAAGLDLEKVEHTNYLPVVRPLARMAPATALGIAERLERRRPLRGALSTQLVVAARGRPGPA
jgi:ubiquinone/menaquinone biosynthesis C-methylase UbiE